jgi:hypothetical protein
MKAEGSAFIAACAHARGIQSSSQTAESNGYPIPATKGLPLPCGPPETIQHSALCEEVPFTNKLFRASIGLPGSQIRLFAQTFWKHFEPETH